MIRFHNNIPQESLELELFLWLHFSCDSFIMVKTWLLVHRHRYTNRVCENKRPGRLIFRSNKKFPKLIKTHQFCVLPPPFEKSPIKTHRFCVLPPPFEKSPIKTRRFMYSPLWKITHQKPIGFVYSPLWKSEIHQDPLKPTMRHYWKCWYAVMSMTWPSFIQVRCFLLFVVLFMYTYCFM